MRIEVNNPDAAPLPLSLVVGVTWIDHLDAYLTSPDKSIQLWHTGDETRDAPGLAPALGYLWPLHFPRGHSELYVRAATPDPMVLTVALKPPAEVVVRRSFPRAQRICAAHHTAVRSRTISSTANFGVAERGAHATLEELIRAAAEQLYKAKHQGRNHVCAETIGN